MAALALGAECGRPPIVTFEVQVPQAVASNTEWIQVGVLPTTCVPTPQLGEGIPPAGTVTSLTFVKGDNNPPAIGDLKKAAYGFAAVARASDCSVVASGCTVADLTKDTDVTIALSATTTEAGACVAGESCVTGRCVPAYEVDSPTVGAGCSMQFVGSGPLGLDRLDTTGIDTASAPAIAVTDSGFLIAYREYDGDDTAQLTVDAVDEGGSLSANPPTMLPSQCEGQTESDAVGAAFFGGTGIVVSARPTCSESQPAGFDVFQVAATGKLGSTAFNGVSGGKPALSNAHSVALGSASSGWLAFLSPNTGGLNQTAASLDSIAISALQTTPASSGFAGTPPQTIAEVAASDQLVALLAGTGSSLQLQLGATPAGAGTPFTVNGSWAAIAAEDSRAFVLSNGGTTNQPLAYSAYDLGSTAASVTGTFAPPGQGTIAGGDIASNANHLFFAVEQTGGISLVVYDNASTTPTFLTSINLANDERIPEQVNISGGRLAVAASDSRVLVAWITAVTLSSNDPVGGYALYACAP